MPGQGFSLTCKAGVYRQAGAGGVCLQLTLRDAQIEALGANKDGQAAVEQALQHAFAEIVTQTDTAESGLLQLQAWQFAEDGRTKPPSVRLVIQTEQG